MSRLRGEALVRARVAMASKLNSRRLLAEEDYKLSCETGVTSSEADTYQEMWLTFGELVMWECFSEALSVTMSKWEAFGFHAAHIVTRLAEARHREAVFEMTDSVMGPSVFCDPAAHMIAGGEAVSEAAGEMLLAVIHSEGVQERAHEG